MLFPIPLLLIIIIYSMCLKGVEWFYYLTVEYIRLCDCLIGYVETDKWELYHPIYSLLNDDPIYPIIYYLINVYATISSTSMRRCLQWDIIWFPIGADTVYSVFIHGSTCCLYVDDIQLGTTYVCSDWLLINFPTLWFSPIGY